MYKIRPANFSLSIPRLILLFGMLMMSLPAFSQHTDTASNAKLTVAVAECPPFVMIEEGQYTGLAVMLWERVASEMGLRWEFTEYSLGDLLKSIKNEDKSELPDVGVSCTSVTAEREKLIDFSHSFHETYTAIAVKQTTLWSAVTGFLTSPHVLKGILIILGIALLIGAVFFLLEHKNNKKLFSHPTFLGRILEPTIIGLMFITNGPIRFYRFKTLTARTLATILTLSSTFLIAAITAVLASSFTLSAMQTKVHSLDDLRNLQVGALSNSTSSDFLRSYGIIHETRDDLDSLITDLDQGTLDAVVSDAAFLQFRINQGQQNGQLKSLEVLSYKLEPQNYAFILAQDSALREEINRTLLTVRAQREWREMTTIYLGK